MGVSSRVCCEAEGGPGEVADLTVTPESLGGVLEDLLAGRYSPVEAEEISDLVAFLSERAGLPDHLLQRDRLLARVELRLIQARHKTLREYRRAIGEGPFEYRRLGGGPFPRGPGPLQTPGPLAGPRQRPLPRPPARGPPPGHPP